MNIDDDKIFRHYYEIRKEEHIIVEKFIQDYFLNVSVKKFLKKYHEWLNFNNLSYIYWNTEEYLDWYVRNCNIKNPKCYAYYNKIRDIKLNFTPLTLATAIMHITENIDKNDLKNTSGISINPINECIRFLKNLDIKMDIKQEGMKNVHVEQQSL